MWQQIRTAFVSLILFTILTGVLYPLAITGVAQIAFPRQANGSLIRQGDRIVGSELIGQSFDDPSYFWSRLSGTSPAFNAGASSGSNLGPLNPTLIEAAQARIDFLKWHDADPDAQNASVPIDLVTASGSGLDPHISPASAEYQVKRVAKARRMTEPEVRSLVQQFTEPRQLGVLGEARVNALKLNIALDQHSADARH